jgi:ribosomal protein S18 acetylase RimI-like enzyme
VTRSSLHFRLGSPDGERDRIQAFVRARSDRHIHVLDLPYRLASPAYGSSEVALWETDQRELAAFAVWQPAFKMLDYGLDPGHAVARLGDGMIDWIESWFGQLAQARVGPSTCWLKVGAANSDLVPLLEQRGFTRCPWSIVHLERRLGAEAQAQLPPGFSIRAGSDVSAESWAALHRAVFPRVGMSPDWRMGITQSPWYQSNLDLIVSASDQRTVACCGAWVGQLQRERVGEIEPLGVHPDFRGKRLGRALLGEVMRRMAADGAARVFVEPWDDNLLAVHAYESMGFRQTFKIPTFAKQYS